MNLRTVVQIVLLASVLVCVPISVTNAQAEPLAEALPGKGWCDVLRFPSELLCRFVFIVIASTAENQDPESTPTPTPTPRPTTRIEDTGDTFDMVNPDCFFVFLCKGLVTFQSVTVGQCPTLHRVRLVFDDTSTEVPAGVASPFVEEYGFNDSGKLVLTISGTLQNAIDIDESWKEPANYQVEAICYLD